MVSQDAARALVTTACRYRWQVRLQGGSFQFGAVGVGGVLELAKQTAQPGRVWLLDDANDVHRFQLRTGGRDKAYAAHSVALRTGADPEQAAATVMEHAWVYASDAERLAATAAGWAVRTHAGRGLVIASTNEQTQQLNGLIRDQLAAAGIVGAGKAIPTTPIAGRWESETISVGDVVATRANAQGADGSRYANRERWRVRSVDADAGVQLVSLDGTRATRLSARAAREHLQLAYAVTGYGAQGLTVDEAVQLVDEGMDRPAFYVGATRGRYANEAALVAPEANPDLARRLAEAILGQPGADTGWKAADLLAVADRERMGDLVNLHSTHVPPIDPQHPADAAPAPARLTQVAQAAAEPTEIADQEAAVAGRLETAAGVAAGYAAWLAAAEQAAAQLDADRAAAISADTASLTPAVARVDALRQTAAAAQEAADRAGLLQRGRARQQAAAAGQAAQDADYAFHATWGYERGAEPAGQVVARIANARARRWTRLSAAAKKDATTIRAQARQAILAALGNLDPTWVRPYAHNLDQAVQAGEPGLAQARLQQAAADLRESSSERAKLAADLQAASPQERLDWLHDQEAAAERAWRDQERVEPPARRPLAEDELGRSAAPDRTPRR